MRSMHQTVLALLAPLAINSTAQAAAWAEIDLTGDSNIHLRLDHTGFGMDYQRIPFSVRAGEVQTFHWNYRLSVHDDGLPATPSQAELIDYMTYGMFYVLTRPPAPSGYEFARTLLAIGSPVDGRATPPFINLGGFFVERATEGGPQSDLISQTGEVSVDVSIDPRWTDLTEYSGSFGLLASQWVVTSPVPEPTTVALMLTGLALVGVHRKKRLAKPSRILPSHSSLTA